MDRAEGHRVVVDELRPALEEEWDAAWQGCPHATFFHAREWAEIWQRASGGRLLPAPRLVRFADGARAVLAACAEQAGRFGPPRLVSAPAGTYGGWLAAGPLSEGQRDWLCEWLLARSELRWRGNPFEPGLAGRLGTRARADETHVLRLESDGDAVLRRWSKGHRAAAKQGEREGVEVRLAKDEDDWRAYYEVYQDTLRRWGDGASSRYDWDLFRELARSDSGRVALWLAERDGEALAGAVCLHAPRHVAYWHGAARADAFRLRPVHRLLAAVVRDACARGREWFDFNPSGGHAGVRAFKSHFGCEVLSSPVVRRERPGGWRRRLGF